MDKLEIGPRRPSSVCIFHCRFGGAKIAHGNSERRKSIVVLSSGLRCSSRQQSKEIKDATILQRHFVK
jgi:hypothetical protein